VGIRNVQAEAWTYLRSNGNGKSIKKATATARALKKQQQQQQQKQNTGVLRCAQNDKICRWYEREQATAKAKQRLKQVLRLRRRMTMVGKG
jgi:hypothetical protein